MKINEYLTFTRRERNGIIALLILLLIVILLTRIHDNQPVASNVQFNARESIDTIIQSQQAVANPWKNKKESSNKLAVHYKPKSKQTVIEINTADTTALIALPGIGSKLASRIVSVREKLGGFYDVQQVGEVYGLQDSVFRKLLPLFRCDTLKVRKINVNVAGKEELKNHPYIRWNIANALVTYRNEHGSFRSAVDLTNVENIDNESLQKIKPYLSFN